MVKRIWDQYLTERDKKVFQASGFGTNGGGGDAPALLIIDVNYAFCGEKPEPILDSIKTWRASCGEDAWRAIPHIKKLRDKCWETGVPVIYTTGTVRPDGWDKGSWAWKTSRTTEDVVSKISQKAGHKRDPNDIIQQIGPRTSDLIIRKHKPSAFYGTPLIGFLNDLGADSLIVVGTTTSGCVRASVLDAFSNNIRCLIAEEGCFDRSQASHAINLFDMNAKYADVVSVTEILEYIGSVNANYNLPTG